MARIQFWIPVNDKWGGHASIEIENAPYQPRVGEFVRIEGYREVLKIEHYYGVPPANGRKDVQKSNEANSQSCYTGKFMTLEVTLGQSIEDRE